MSRLSAACLVMLSFGLFPPAFAQTAEPHRVVLKTADLTGTDKEIIIAVLEVPPGATIARHTHPGEEAVYVLEGARFQRPDRKEIDRPGGRAGVNVRDVPPAGYKIAGDKALKILTVH